MVMMGTSIRQMWINVQFNRSFKNTVKRSPGSATMKGRSPLLAWKGRAVIILNIRTPKTFVVFTLKFEQDGFTGE